MAKKQATDDRRRKAGTAGPVAKLMRGTLDADLVAGAGKSLRVCAVICESVIKSATSAAPVVRDIDTALELAAQLARGAKNRVHGVCFDAGKYAMISKPKLNELKRALRQAGVKI